MSGREFEIIERYFTNRILSVGPGVVLGPGDDCAILDVAEGDELCTSTDTLVEGVHLPVGASGVVAASRVFAANMSDLAAMGAVPVGFILALTMPDEDENWLEDFSLTLAALADRYRTPLVGGNLARGPLSITLTVFGATPEGKALRRSGAAAGDDIHVSGAPGEAAGGLALLEAGEARSELIDRYERPTPRIDLGRQLVGCASALIDVSDGLIADLGHIASASRVGATVELDCVPISAALRSRFGEERAVRFALSGGDDYELCFTAPPSMRERVGELERQTGIPLTRIGCTTEAGSVRVVNADGESVHVDDGYQHFHGR